MGQAYQVGVRRACAVLGLSRTSYYYRSIRIDDFALRKRIREIAETRIRYGYQRIHVLLRREGWPVNHKRVYRIYCEEGLNFRSKRPKRRRSAAHRKKQPQATRIDQVWSMDFVADNLFNGRRIRALTVVDIFRWQSPAIHMDHSIKAEQVVSTMDALRLFAGRMPERIQVDNGPEFISKALDKRAYENGVTFDLSRPGKPMDNAFIESFNGSFLNEFLNVHCFLSVADARKKIEQWRWDCNRFRPYSSLWNKPPDQFMEEALESRISLQLPGTAKG